MPSTYNMGDDKRLIRCWNCKSQIQYNVKEVKVEEYYDHREAHTINVVYCPNCHRRIVVLPF